MDPESGDKSILVHPEDVTAAAQSVGIVPGDTVMFHSSLSSMGTVVGGPDTVIDGFLAAVGPEGTVAVPTLWWKGFDMKIADFDVDTSPSYPGIITEHFRKRPDSVRSNNPTHSVSAIGARAEELTRDHGKSGLRPCVFGDTAFAEASPWERFYQWDAAYCFIGVDFSVNTMGHYVESEYARRAVAAAPPDLRAALDDELGRWQKPGLWLRYPFAAMGEHLADLGLVRFGKIGSATLRCIRTRDMVDNIIRTLDTEPEKWFSEEIQDFLRRARGEEPMP